MAGTKRDFALIKHGHSLDELDDLDLSGVVDNSLIQYNASTSTWEDVTLAAVNAQLDHGTLAGLADDDHPQYAAIAQAETITETWTWTDNAEVRLGTGADLRLYHDGTNNQIRSDNGEIVFRMNNARSIAIGTDETLRIGNRVTSLITNIADPAIYSASGSGSGDFALAGTLFIQPRSSAARDVIIMAGSTSPTERLRAVGASDIVRMNRDNAEFQWGAGNDLRVYHDGTDSIIRNDTGIFKLNQGANGALWFNANRAFGAGGANYGNSGDVLTSAGSGGPPTWQTPASGAGSLVFISETTVAGAAATDITVTGLDLNADECYEIDLILDNATASGITVSLFYNSDTTATNYDRTIATSGGAETNANNANVAGVIASSTAWYRLIIRNDFDARPRCLTEGTSGNTTALRGQSGSQMWRTASTNVTQIIINSSVASGFSIGSKVIVWKRVT